MQPWWAEETSNSWTLMCLIFNIIQLNECKVNIHKIAEMLLACFCTQNSPEIIENPCYVQNYFTAHAYSCCSCKRVFLVVYCRAEGNQWRCIFKYLAGFWGRGCWRGRGWWWRGSVQMLQRENGHLQEQLRSSEELNATLRSELDLTRSILKHNQQTEDKQPEQQNTSASKTINSGRVREL